MMQHSSLSGSRKHLPSPAIAPTSQAAHGHRSLSYRGFSMGLSHLSPSFPLSSLSLSSSERLFESLYVSSLSTSLWLSSSSWRDRPRLLATLGATLGARSMPGEVLRRSACRDGSPSECDGSMPGDAYRSDSCRRGEVMSPGLPPSGRSRDGAGGGLDASLFLLRTGDAKAPFFGEVRTDRT